MPTPGTHCASAKPSLSVICCLFGKTASPTTTCFHISLVEEAVPINALIHFSLFFHLWHCGHHLLWGLPCRPGRMAGRGCLWPSASGGGSAKAKGRAHTAAAAAPLPPVPTGLWFAEQPDAAAKREHHAVKFICGYGASTARKSPQRYSQLIISTACDGREAQLCADNFMCKRNFAGTAATTEWNLSSPLISAAAHTDPAKEMAQILLCSFENKWRIQTAPGWKSVLLFVRLPIHGNSELKYPVNSSALN